MIVASCCNLRLETETFWLDFQLQNNIIQQEFY